jgi:hypothetical protein
MQTAHTGSVRGGLKNSTILDQMVFGVRAGGAVARFTSQGAANPREPVGNRYATNSSPS